MEVINFIVGFLLGRISNKIHIKYKSYDEFWEEFELNQDFKEWSINQNDR